MLPHAPTRDQLRFLRLRAPAAYYNFIRNHPRLAINADASRPSHRSSEASTSTIGNASRIYPVRRPQVGRISKPTQRNRSYGFQRKPPSHYSQDTPASPISAALSTSVVSAPQQRSCARQQPAPTLRRGERSDSATNIASSAKDKLIQLRKTPILEYTRSSRVISTAVSNAEA